MATVKFTVERTLSSGTAPASGLKGLAFDSRPPLLNYEPAATYERVSDERGRHQPARARRQDAPDPGHCDPTVNLYDRYVCVRGNRVGQV
jgi:D-threonine aldolase